VRGRAGPLPHGRGSKAPRGLSIAARPRPLHTGALVIFQLDLHVLEQVPWQRRFAPPALVPEVELIGAWGSGWQTKSALLVRRRKVAMIEYPDVGRHPGVNVGAQLHQAGLRQGAGHRVPPVDDKAVGPEGDENSVVVITDELQARPLRDGPD